MSVSARSICQITTVHPRFDVRVFHKITLSLAADYKVNLIVADGKGNEIIGNVNIFDVGNIHKSRLRRMIITSYNAYRKALELDCVVYHFHDPEFLFFGYKLSRKGKSVIYDAHEDLPRQILSKNYLNGFFKPVISKAAEAIENYISRYFYAIITATPKINDRFSRVNCKTVTICNYAIIEECASNIDYSQRENSICYIGGISKSRGITELISSLEYVASAVTLILAGEIEGKSLEAELHSYRNWEKVKYLGYVGRNEIKSVLASSRIGILTLHPTPNHVDSYPIKLFEYMAAGIPVIASDFLLWKDIIEGNKCGICVNPKDPEDISNAVNYLQMNEQIAQDMGKNGYLAALNKYNWNSEKAKLLTLYSSIFE